MSEKPDIRSFFKRDESSQKGDDNTLSSKQGGGDSEKMLQKAAGQVAKRKSHQTNYDKTKRQRVLKESWSKEFGWMDIDVNENALFCRVCRKFPKLNDPGSSLVTGIREKYRKETLKFHERSRKHIKCVEHERVL